MSVSVIVRDFSLQMIDWCTGTLTAHYQVAGFGWLGTGSGWLMGGRGVGVGVGGGRGSTVKSKELVKAVLACPLPKVSQTRHLQCHSRPKFDIVSGILVNHSPFDDAIHSNSQ